MQAQEADERMLDWLTSLLLPPCYWLATLSYLWWGEGWKPEWMAGFYEVTTLSRMFLVIFITLHVAICWVYCLTYSFTGKAPQGPFLSFCNAVWCAVVLMSCVFSSGSIPWPMACLIRWFWVTWLVGACHKQEWSTFANVLNLPWFYQLAVDLVFYVPWWGQLGLWMGYMWWCRSVIVECTSLMWTILMHPPRIESETRCSYDS